MTLIAATGNRGKLVEIREILGPHFDRILSQKEAGLFLDVEEDADTFAGNAMKKARAFCEATGMPAVADDSGLCVDALNGEPGVYSARFAGQPFEERWKNDEANNDKLLEELGDLPPEKRGARYVCHIALSDPDGNIRAEAENYCCGRIRTERSGTNGFGYDPLFSKTTGMP